jgi:hypothetical protein
LIIYDKGVEFVRKRLALIPIIFGTTLLVGCEGTTATIDTGNTQTDHHISSTHKKSSDKKETENKGKPSNATAKKTEVKKQDKTPEKPKKPKKSFKPIQPSKNAKPLKGKYSAKVKKHMPTEEAHGGSTKRSVPLGQTLLKGKKDLTNGPLKHHRLVAFYGTPRSKNMGILGEKPPEEMMKQLKKQAKAYSEADPSHPAVPTIELIATVAQRNPGPDGLYVLKTPRDVIKRYAELAKKNHALLLLDVQLGRASVMHGVKAVAPFLKLPYVHLAIDTEYSVDKGKVPGIDLGHVDGTEIQKAVEYVDQLVEKNHLPDKVVVVHQFGNGIVTHKNLIKPTEHVEIPLNYDGFGDPAVKMAAYGKLVRKQPIQYGGFKLFFKNDHPLLSPKEVLKLDPAPAVVDYQ